MAYELRHFDTPLMRFTATEDTSTPEIEILWVNEEKKALLPLDMNIDGDSVSRWLRHRTIPKNRAYVHSFLSKCGLNLNRPMSILSVSKGLSLNDCYWVVEEGFEGGFSQYNLYENRFSRVLGLIAFTGYGSSVRTSLTSCPEFTTNGMLPKCWRRENGVIRLYKGGTSGASNTGNEPYSEFYAAQIADALGINAISYGLSKWQGELCSTCELFTDIDHSYVPIHRFVENYSLRTVSDYLKKLGKDYYDDFVDMLVFDALIYNEDRHFGNFGLIVDNKTNKPCGFAPLFDHGLSLFNYAMPDEVIDNLDEYAKTRSSAYGVPFENVVKEFVTARQKEQLRRMIGFSFNPHRRYNPPVNRFRKIGEHLQKRTRALLEIPSR